MEDIFFFGLGYTSTKIAKTLQAKGIKVAGSVRHPEKREALRCEGITAICFDDEDTLIPALQSCSHVIVSIPTVGGEDLTLLKYGALLEHIKPVYIGYLSSTVVYGNHDGALVNEETVCAPSSSRGHARLCAEKSWQQLAAKWHGCCDVFRLAGIYGPHRNALKSVQTGKARKIFKKGQVFGRIHRDDIVKTVIQAMHEATGKIYNVNDDAPAPPWEVIAYAEELLKREPKPLIPIEQADLSPMAQSFYQDNKRVCNRRIKEELGIKLSYPSYKEGLDALLKSEHIA